MPFGPSCFDGAQRIEHFLAFSFHQKMPKFGTIFFGSNGFTPAKFLENKKGLNFCNPLIFLAYMAPPAGLEPATQ